MINQKQFLKQITPLPIWQAVSQFRYALYRASLWPEATFHPWRRASIKRLADFHNLHRGKRCFIIGNGPSLKQTDLNLLHEEITFGMNRIYLLFAELGFSTTYYVSINSLVIEQCYADIASLVIPKFLSWRSHRLFRNFEANPSLPNDNTLFLHTTYTGPIFAKDARKRLWEGATVTYVTLQLAYFMGFQQVILIGVDHSFSTSGEPNTTVVTQGDDPDHFNKGYFGKGFRWQLPDLKTSEKAYRMAGEAFQAEGREIIDATINGKLTVFPKVDYYDLFPARL